MVEFLIVWYATMEKYDNKDPIDWSKIRKTVNLPGVLMLYIV